MSLRCCPGQAGEGLIDVYEAGSFEGKTLETCINALFYGYDRRRRNGYRSLDPMTLYERSVRFDDLRVPGDHPDIRSGRAENKNLFR